jgi:hypothetical protein
MIQHLRAAAAVGHLLAEHLQVVHSYFNIKQRFIAAVVVAAA